MIPVLGIPYYNRPDLLTRCIRSIDCPLDALVIIENQPTEYLATRLDANPVLEACSNLIKHLYIIRHPNVGVAGAWNEVIKLFPAPWWMLANNDIQFAPGDLANMAKWAFARQSEVSALFGNHGHSFFVITRRGVEKVGLFDENIYPAYLEDCDWMWRLKCAEEIYLDVPEIRSMHGDDKSTGSCTIMSDARARANNHVTHTGNFEYYRRKWGGNNGQEKFKHPFNDPRLPVDYWKFEPATRAHQQWR